MGMTKSDWLPIGVMFFLMIAACVIGYGIGKLIFGG